MSNPLDRLKRTDARIQQALDALSQLNGPDLTSVLLDVFSDRGAVATQLPTQQQASRFTRPAPIPFEAIRAAEDAVLAALRGRVELIQLAPAAPLGAHVALGGSSQDRLVSTVRRTEMAADPTLGLALEAAGRRKSDRTDMTLGTLQRVTRAQAFEGPRTYAHFTLFGMVTAGRDRGALGFERFAAIEHLELMTDAITRAGGQRVEITVIDPNPDQPILHAVTDALGGEVAVRDDAVQLGEYYQTARFGITAEIDGTRFDLGDGGFTPWTAMMLSDRKERLCISGISIDRLAVLTKGDDPPETP